MPTNKVDSNSTGLAIAEEETIGVLPATPDWYAHEPNSYSDFGGSVTTVARTPIKKDRQRAKGVVTDKDANFGFETDVTFWNLYGLLQGYLFASWRKKDEDVVTAVSGTQYTIAAGGADYRANDLVLGVGFNAGGNDGVHLVSASTATTVSAAGLTAEAGPPATAYIKRVGHQFAAGDLEADLTGGVKSLVTTTKDLTELGLIPGEWLYVGGDAAGERFATDGCNGWVRVKSVAAHAIVLDKTQGTWATDAGAAKTVRVFLGDVLKNESDPNNIVRRTYQAERDLAAGGSEYVLGGVPAQLDLNVGTATKVTASLTFVGTDSEERSVGDGLKAGNRLTFPASDAFNTSSDFGRLRLADSDDNGLGNFVQEVTLTVNNGPSPNKAIGTVGAFDVSAGDFAVSGRIVAYFTDAVTQKGAVAQNLDTTLDFALVKANRGILVDLPLLALGDGKLAIEKDRPITIPFGLDAAAHATYNHTMLVGHFQYLPNAAG